MGGDLCDDFVSNFFSLLVHTQKIINASLFL